MSATKEIPQIDVQLRGQLGSRYATRLRKTGQLPGVIYGHKKDPIHVSVDYKVAYTLLHANSHLLQAKLETGTESVLIRDVQWDHLGTTLVHIDLARVDLTERVTVEVPLRFIGDAPGLTTEGAILTRPVTELEVEVLVTEIPEEIVVDVSNLNVGDAITVGDIKLPSNVTATADPETIVVSVSVMEEEAEAPEVDADAPAEPKVIGKEESDEAPAPAADAKKK